MKQINNDLFEKPDHFPEPHYDFKSNPLTENGISLGKALFFEPMLSRDNTISCGSCHQQSSAFTQHGHDLSHGIDDLLTLRNSMPIQNMAWLPNFGWDGGIPHLDLFSVSPIEKENEMGETLSNVLDKLRSSEEYPEMFERAFGSEEVTTDRFLKALSQFMLTLVSANSKYDQYLNGNASALTETEISGLKIFEQKCSSCHSGVLLTDFSFRNNGFAGKDVTDTGRESITLLAEDKYKFRVPSLRNVAVTFPYMHDGSVETLEDVLDHYTGLSSKDSYADPLLRKGISLNNEEKGALIAFLETLTDNDFLKNIKFSEPGSDVIVTDEFNGNWETTDFGKVEPFIKKAIVNATKHYLQIKNALAVQDGKGASSAATEMYNTLAKIDKDKFTPLQKSFFSKTSSDLLFDVEHIEETKDYKHQLDHFGAVSENLYKTVKAFKVGTDTPLYYLHCTDAAKRNKGGYWLSEHKTKFENPYSGKKNHCGKLTDIL